MYVVCVKEMLTCLFVYLFVCFAHFGYGACFVVSGGINWASYVLFVFLFIYLQYSGYQQTSVTHSKNLFTT